MLPDFAGRVSRPQIQPLVAGDPAELGGYEIRGRIGSGGMGAVYLAATRTGRRLAIKVIHPERTGDPEFRARFRREASAATRVRSRGTAAMIDFDVDAAMPWIATEYVPGPTLAQAVAELGPLPQPEVKELLAGVSEALDAIHREGLVHRDVKPANVLLGPNGPVLIDMGIVAEPEATSLTMTGLQPGTPQFMSPEQARGDAVGPQSDVWSLGAVAFLAATGRAPFGTGSLAAMTYRIVHDEPVLTEVPDGVRRLVAACLVKEPDARPTASAVLRSMTGPAPGADLPVYRPTADAGTPDDPTQLRAGQSEPDGETTVPDGRGSAPRSRRALIAGLVAAGLVLAGGVTALAVQFFPGSEEHEPVIAASSSGIGTASLRPTGTATQEPKKKNKKSPEPSSSPRSSVGATTVGNPPDEQEPAGPSAFAAGKVTILGKVQVGQELVAKAEGWDPQPSGSVCTWSIGGDERDNLGSCAYTVLFDDVGKTIQVSLEATRDGYAATSERSGVTGAVPTPHVAQPKCSIAFHRTADDHWSGYCRVDEAEEVTYEWRWWDLDSDELVGTNEVHVQSGTWVRDKHAGHRIRCTVTATRDGYITSEWVTETRVPKL